MRASAAVPKSEGFIHKRQCTMLHWLPQYVHILSQHSDSAQLIAISHELFYLLSWSYSTIIKVEKLGLKESVDLGPRHVCFHRHMLSLVLFAALRTFP